MPITKSAKKALRSSQKKREFNLARLTKIRNARRIFNKTLNLKEFDTKKAMEAMSTYFSELDKAAKSNLFHKNKSSRLKSRAYIKLNKTQAANSK